MRSKVIVALAMLNALLLASLLLQVWTPSSAHAQAAAARAGDYLMIPGDIQGGNGGALVYIIDNASGQLSARQVDVNGHRLNDAPPIPLDRILGAQPKR